MSHVRDFPASLLFKLTKDGTAHLMNRDWTACGVFWTPEVAGPDAEVCEKCLISRPKCDGCGKRQTEDYECWCCDYGRCRHRAVMDA